MLRHILLVFVVFCCGLIAFSPARAEPGLENWPARPDGRGLAADGHWDMYKLHGPVKSILMDAYLGVLQPDGSVRKAGSGQPVSFPEDFRCHSLWGSYPYYGEIQIPYTETYDRQGRLLERLELTWDRKLVRSFTNCYSPGGNLVRELVQFPLPVKERIEVVYSYDPVTGKLAAIAREPYYEPDQPVHYEYDEPGRLARITGWVMHNDFIPEEKRIDPEKSFHRVKVRCTVYFTYDEQGRVRTIQTHDQNGGQTVFYTYEQDGALRRAEVTQTGLRGRYLPAYTQYDAQGRTEVEASFFTFYGGDANNFIVTHTRDNEGRIIRSLSQTTNTGRPGEQWDTVHEYVYDPQGNMIRMSLDYGHEIADTVVYDYDGRGNWVRAAYTNMWLDREVPEPPTPAVLERRIEYWD